MTQPPSAFAASSSSVLIDASSLVLVRQTHPIVLLDCRFELSDPTVGERAYAQAHARGALYAHLDRDLSSPRAPDPRSPSFTGRHPLPSREAFSATLGRWGITPATDVVCLDAHGCPYAARAWWLLRWMGHSRVRVLDGGWQAWLDAGGPVDDARPVVQATQAYPSMPPAMPHIDASNLLSKLEKLTIVDARSADRFRGENEILDPVAGHIPGALNRNFRDNLDAAGRFKPADQLRKEWDALLEQASAGRPGSTDVVQQCGSGVTACQNLLALMHAGGPVTTLYPGSWSEWGADPARPRATGEA